MFRVWLFDVKFYIIQRFKILVKSIAFKPQIIYLSICCCQYVSHQGLENIEICLCMLYHLRMHGSYSNAFVFYLSFHNYIFKFNHVLNNTLFMF